MVSELRTDAFVTKFHGSSSIRWSDEMRSALRKHGVLIFEKSDVEQECPQLCSWLQKHYFGLSGRAKTEASGRGEYQSGGHARALMEEPDLDSSDLELPLQGTEHLRLEKKQLVHFEASFCRGTTDKRLRSCFEYMETHALQCVDALINENHFGEDVVDEAHRPLVRDAMLKPVDLGVTARDSSRSVLSAFVYNCEAPMGELLCEDHVDRGIFTCTTNVDGGLEIFVDGGWLRLPPTRGLVCFAGFFPGRVLKDSNGNPCVQAVRHRVVSTGAGRVSIAFKLRPDFSKLPRELFHEMYTLQDEMDRQFLSVNQPVRQLYQRRAEEDEAPVSGGAAQVRDCPVETIALGHSGFVRHCWRNGVPWQAKPAETTWGKHCAEWARKIREWESRTFLLHVQAAHYGGGPAPAVRETVEVKFGWERMMTDLVRIYMGLFSQDFRRTYLGLFLPDIANIIH